MISKLKDTLYVRILMMHNDTLMVTGKKKRRIFESFRPK